MSFPLYDVIYKDCIDVDLTLEQKRELINKIPSLDNMAHQNIFTIIRIYGLKHNNTNIFELPYDAKKNNENIKFNLEKLPNIVKQMLYKFVIKTINNNL